MIEWQWKQFKNLNTDELHEIFQVRQQVFVVEQNCVYQDVDGLDQYAWHLLGYQTAENSGSRQLVAYCRVVYPAHKYQEPSIGRLLTVESVRKTGLGKQLLSVALINTEKEYPYKAVKISAQLYLQNFYSQFGFENVSSPYDEDGIPHIEMLRKATL